MTIDLSKMIRSGRIRDGYRGEGRLRFAYGGEPLTVVKYYCDLIDPEFAWLDLKFRCDALKPGYPIVDQPIRLLFTQPQFGGRRWWMRCPDTGLRLAKLYCPIGGTAFASRGAWQLVYESQRQDARGRAFGRLFQFQRKLGCDERWGAEPTRPKGMWRSTFRAYLREFRELDARCGDMTDAWMAEIRRIHN